MAKVILNNGGVKIVGWQTEEGFYLRAYEDGNFVETSDKDPDLNERQNFIQRWF